MTPIHSFYRGMVSAHQNVSSKSKNISNVKSGNKQLNSLFLLFTFATMQCVLAKLVPGKPSAFFLDCNEKVKIRRIRKMGLNYPVRTHHSFVLLNRYAILAIVLCSSGKDTLPLPCGFLFLEGKKSEQIYNYIYYTYNWKTMEWSKCLTLLILY